MEGKMRRANYPPPAENERERLREAMLRLPNATADRVDKMLYIFCGAMSAFRHPDSYFGDEADYLRKPDAFCVTTIAATSFAFVTNGPVRRTSKFVEGKFGKQETGAFARFLTEVFGIIGIKASAAGQVKTFNSTLNTPEHRRRHRLTVATSKPVKLKRRAK
jgi:hypothetical protein